jgi:macrolide transport system ATP-binding/permease protein
MSASMQAPLIELRNISRRYVMGKANPKPGEPAAVVVPALQGVSLRIEAGEYVAIIGQSGSGKSTLMNILGCLDRPSEGQFLIDGKDASGFEPDELAALRRERFGFIFQRYHLLAGMNAQANAALPAVYAGRPLKERMARAAQLLAGLGLGERMHHKPNELSGGQQQRVSIARALMNGGQIILADEPTGALDSTSGADMLRQLDALHAQGHTIIVVTHDHKVAAHAKRVIELSDGRVLRDSGTPPGHQPPAQPKTLGSGAGSWWAHWRGQLREALSSAASALMANRLRTALSMLGICIGITAVVSTSALGDAARRGIEGSLGASFASKLWVWSSSSKLPPGAQAQSFRPYELEAMRAIPGVVDIQAERQLQGSLRWGPEQVSGQTQTATPTSLQADRNELELGRYFTDAEMDSRAQVAVVNHRLWKDLFKSNPSVLGEVVLIDTAATSMAGAVGAAMPVGGAIPVRVVGVLKEKRDGDGFDGRMAGLYVPLSTYVAKIDASPNVMTFRVLVAQGQDPNDVEKQVRHRLKALHGAEDFGIWNGDSTFRNIQNTFGIIALVFTGVGAIALLVGGVGVMNIMLVSVSERTREIGIRMAVGARQSDVRLQFLIESVVLCCLGGLAGLVLCWLAGQGVNAAQDQIAIEISGKAVLLAFGVSSAIGLIFGTLPARRAAALSPVEALSRE